MCCVMLLNFQIENLLYIIYHLGSCVHHKSVSVVSREKLQSNYQQRNKQTHKNINNIKATNKRGKRIRFIFYVGCTLYLLGKIRV
jgi:hypothetical protein